jgi:hypothetical protein
MYLTKVRIPELSRKFLSDWNVFACSWIPNQYIAKNVPSDAISFVWLFHPHRVKALAFHNQGTSFGQ